MGHRLSCPWGKTEAFNPNLVFDPPGPSHGERRAGGSSCLVPRQRPKHILLRLKGSRGGFIPWMALPTPRRLDSIQSVCRKMSPALEATIPADRAPPPCPQSFLYTPPPWFSIIRPVWAAVTPQGEGTVPLRAHPQWNWEASAFAFSLLPPPLPPPAPCLPAIEPRCQEISWLLG